MDKNNEQHISELLPMFCEPVLSCHTSRLELVLLAVNSLKTLPSSVLVQEKEGRSL